MPIPNDYQDIVSMLVAKTEGGNVHWRQGRFAEIVVSFDGSKFSVWAGNDEHSDEPFVAFALQDDQGSTLDSWYVEEHEGSEYTAMHRLYKAAKRCAGGVPDKLRLIREKLAATKEIGSDE